MSNPAKALHKEPKDTTVLLVDDEPDFRNALAFSFKRKGYQVLFAANGKEAFDVILSRPVDVVVSDIRMPEGDGIELLDRAKERAPLTPIILLVTGFADLTAEDAHNRGAEALFGKPLDAKSLHETIDRLLTPPEERWARSADRVDAELRIELKFPNLVDAIAARVISIGRGGMFVATDQDHFPNVNETVAFKIAFGGSAGFMEGNGCVRWVRIQRAEGFPAGCGIEYGFLSGPERQKILDFLGAANPKAFIPNR